MTEIGSVVGRSCREELQRGIGKHLGGDVHVHYLDCGDGFTMYSYVKTTNCTL